MKRIIATVEIWKEGSMFTAYCHELELHYSPAVYAFGEDAGNLEKITGEFIEGRGQSFITKARNEGARIENIGR